MKAMHWLLPLLSLALVLLVTAWEMGTARESPGPLHPSHASVRELRGGSRCEACHRQGEGVDMNACIACHAPIGRQSNAKTGLHGSLPAAQLAACGQCHPEHHGAAAPLIALHAFARAGVDDPEHYDHRHVPDFGLLGAHVALPCERCHSAAASVAAPAGGRFLGLQQGCTSCHEDVHRGVYGGKCESCHGQDQPFAQAPGFKHASFPLRDAHARVACAQCHPVGTAHDVGALQAKSQPVRTCAVCHQDPHHTQKTPNAAAVVKVAAIQLVADTADCSRCHAATTWKAAKVTPERHAEFGFPLRGAHATTDCAACHGDRDHAPRYGAPSPKVDSCAVCHKSPHSNSLLVLATAQQGPRDGCANCHGDQDGKFAAGKMTIAQHAMTGVKLTDPHAKVDCAKCHAGTEWKQRFPGRRASECRSCHQDVHKGQFDHDKNWAQCTACHVETTFKPHAFDLAAHQRTQFPLTGSHQAVACQLCHKNELQPGVRAFHGQKGACGDCHEDVHKGKFDQAGKPRAISGRVGCQRCHDTKAFAPVATFDHAAWTGYALEGAHGKVACSDCHAPQRQQRGERRLGAPAGKRCADCHRDVHQGQLAVANYTDCARCHDQQDWKKGHFDHQKESRFPLDKQHVNVACAKCHQSWPSAQGPVVRYKPLGTACGDCHKLGTVGGKR